MRVARTIFVETRVMNKYYLCKTVYLTVDCVDYLKRNIVKTKATLFETTVSSIAPGMSDTRVAPQLRTSDWENTAKSYFRNDGKYIAMPEIERLP